MRLPRCYDTSVFADIQVFHFGHVDRLDYFIRVVWHGYGPANWISSILSKNSSDFVIPWSTTAIAVLNKA